MHLTPALESDYRRGWNPLKLVSPVVLKLGETKIDIEGVHALLKHLEVPEEALRRFDGNMVATNESPENLVELAGRMCYRSFSVGLNPNVTKIRIDSEEYFRNILSKGDGSILEHVQVNWAFLNVSRVFTHELCRHRVGVAISQESLRYVRPREIGLWLPEGLTPGQKAAMIGAAEQAEKAYRALEDLTDWDKMSFGQKKVTTSAFRRILPDGMATNVVWSANLRTLRHVIEMRTDPAAEIEIRIVFDKVAQICKRDYPMVFQDFVRTELLDGTGSWKPTLRSKV